jgi:hypothetical protein
MLRKVETYDARIALSTKERVFFHDAVQIHTGGGVISSAGGPPGSGRPDPSSRLIARTVMS